MAEAIGAILDDDVLVSSISLALSGVVGPWAFATLHGNGIVVD